MVVPGPEKRPTEDQIEAKLEAGESARYSHFEAILDCNICGEELRVEGDVSNGEIIRCDSCATDLVVENR